MPIIAPYVPPRPLPPPVVHVAPAPERQTPAPDLVVDSVVGSSSRPHVGEPVWYTLTVRNQGSAPAEAFAVGLRGERVYDDRSVPGLAPGEAVTVENMGPVQPQHGGGPFLVQGVADPYGAIPDADRQNNDKWDSLWVQP